MSAADTITGKFRDLVCALTDGKPETMHPMQYAEMEKAFVAGFHTALLTVQQISTNDKATEDEQVVAVEALHEECRAFFKSKEGKG